MTGDMFEKRIHPFLDKELDAAEQASMEQYLKDNPEDKVRVAALQDLIYDLRLLADVSLPDGFHSAAFSKVNSYRRARAGRIVVWRSALTACAAFVLLCVGLVNMRTPELEVLPQSAVVANRQGTAEQNGVRNEELLLSDSEYYYDEADEYEVSEYADDYESDYAAGYDGGVEAITPMVDAESAMDMLVRSNGGSDFQPKSPLSGDPGDMTGEELAAISGLKIIRSADLSIQTRNFDDVMTGLKGDVFGALGYFESSSISGDSEKANRYAYFTVRIPKDAFDDFLGAMRAIEGVGSISEYNRDVTAQYQDNQKRLDSLNNQFARLQELNEKANTVTQLIEIERETQNVLYKIDSLTGDLNYLDAQVSYSTVSINVAELPKADGFVPPSDTLGDRIVSAFYLAVNGFVEFLENTAVWMVSVFPAFVIGIPVLIVAGASIASFRRKHRNSK